MFRIKKLDWLILKSFIGPLLVTYFIVLFVLVMQSFWLYMDDLLGKGFNFFLILELLFYWGCFLTPLALPLGILLASIMTFGTLGENFELVAIKSSGISLFRFIRPLAILIGIISIGAFFFSNNVIPVTNLKTFSLLYDMRNQKPALNIRAGTFNKDIDKYAIHIGSKDKDGQTIHDVIIYDHSSGDAGNNNVVVAEKGKMYPSPDKRALVFELYNGWRYEESDKKDSKEQTRMYFEKWYKIFDLSDFAFSRTKEELFAHNEVMMNISQIQNTVDSTKKQLTRNFDDFKQYERPYMSLYKTERGNKPDTALSHAIKTSQSSIPYQKSFIEHVPDSLKGVIADNASTAAESMKGFIFPIKNNNDLQLDKIIRFNIEFHKKFTMSFACLLLFFIGAPLGAIIRKGGLGMPVLVAIGIFVVYFIITSTGEKLAKEGAMQPWAGLWMATIILFPFAILLLVQARNDSRIFNKEWYNRIWMRIKNLFGNKRFKATS